MEAAANAMWKGEERKISWENFLVQLKEEYYSERDILEITNVFQNQKKLEISVRDYTIAFFEMMELVPYLVPNELSKIENFPNGLPKNFGPLVKQATTLGAALQVASSLEYIVKRKIATKEPEDGNEAIWYKKCRMKHFGQYSEVVTCFRFGKSCHYASQYAVIACFKCGEVGNFKEDCPNKKGEA